MKPSQAIFVPVVDPKEKNKILSDLAGSGGEVRVKSAEPKASIINVRTFSKSEMWLSGRSAGGVFPNLLKDCVLQFDLAEQKYVSKGTVRTKNGVVEIDFSGELFRVQRRQDFRLRIPISFAAHITIVHNGNTSVPCRLLDVSAGGCRAEVPFAVGLKMGEEFFAQLTFADREAMDLHLIVRHLGKHHEKENFQMAGLQFSQTTDFAKNQMASLVLDLYRQFFNKHQ